MSTTTIVLVALALTLALSGLGYVSLSDNNTQTLKTEVPTPVADLWSHWKTENNKRYGSEDGYRLSVFYDNYQKVIEHQANEDRTYEMGFTKFMDLTSEEFQAKYLTTQPSMNRTESILPTLEIPTSVDWRTQGAVTPVKDQGQCGSCWAFSSTGALEGFSATTGRGLQSFSEQQLVDCSSAQGNGGCNGGLMDYAFNYVKRYGITTESSYPYRAVGGSCRISGGAFKITAYVDVQAGSADQLAQAVALRPVAVAVDANNWQLYSSGIFSNCRTSLDHGVLLVGYTSDAWIVKNSWGTGWGENGYIRLARGNTCGIANSASYPSA